MQSALLSTILLLPLALAQEAPFPIAFSHFPPAAGTSISDEVQSYIATMILAPGFSSFTSECSSVVATMAPALANTVIDLGCDPEILGGLFFLETETPGWYNALPTNLQSYVSSIAAHEASIYGDFAGGQQAQTSSGGAAQTSSGTNTAIVIPNITNAPSPSAAATGKSSGSESGSGDLKIVVVTGAAFAAVVLGMLAL
jgi:hypothetical protein